MTDTSDDDAAAGWSGLDSLLLALPEGMPISFQMLSGVAVVVNRLQADDGTTPYDPLKPLMEIITLVSNAVVNLEAAVNGIDDEEWRTKI